MPERSEKGGLERAAERHPVLRTVIPTLVALAAFAALILTASPAQLAKAIERFHIVLLAPVVLLPICFYLLQGVRWWTLLRAGRFRIGLGDTVLLTVTGQSTALLPLGELGRSLLVARVTGSGVGSVLATETVQELLFVGILFVAAIPGAIRLPLALAAVLIATAAVTAIGVALSSARVYRRLHGLVTKTPLLRRIAPAVDELQRFWVKLLEARATYTWLWLSVLQAGVAVTSMWVIVEALVPGRLSWPDAALVYAVTQGASWIGMSPGGLGIFELSTAGFLVVFGIQYGDAAAAALIFRLADKGLGMLIGLSTLPIVHRRYGLTAANVLRLRQAGTQGSRSRRRAPAKSPG
jgi:uncharacterized protein (TIRG00374 family)